MRIKLCVLLMLAAVLTGCNSVATSSESSIGTVMPAAPVSVTPQTTSPAVESPATSADQNVSNPTNAQATNSPDIRESDAGTEAEPTATDSGTKPEETTDPEENNTTVDSYRESIRNRVFAAADYVGVSEELKEKFVDFIRDSDWFAATCIDIPYRTEWSFITDSNGYTTLEVKVWDTDVDLMLSTDEEFYLRNTIYYNGSYVMDGLRSSASY